MDVENPSTIATSAATSTKPMYSRSQRDAPNKTLAELFIAWTGHPHINVRMSNYIPYGPLNTNALPLLPQTLSAERIDALPTSPHALQSAVLLDEKWLAENREFLEERWEKFIQN